MVVERAEHHLGAEGEGASGIGVPNLGASRQDQYTQRRFEVTVERMNASTKRSVGRTADDERPEQPRLVGIDLDEQANEPS